MPLKSILEDLKSDVSFDSHGLFTLDKSKARLKMKKYQLLDPHYYVLELVQAAIAGGATRIDFYIDSDDLIMTFDGMHYTRDELDNIYSSLFVSQKDTSLERFRELAVGLNSAQALNPKFIKIISGDGQQAAQLTFTPPNNEVLVEPEEIIKGTRIHVKDRISWRAAARFLNRIADKLPAEGRIIKKHCMYCNIPISINQKQIEIHDKMSDDDVLCSIKFNQNGIKGIIGIPKSHHDKTSLQFVKLGVLINTKHMKLSYIPVVGVIHGDHLTKNASQSDIVENSIYKETLNVVKSKFDELVCVLADRYKDIDPSSESPEELKSLDIFYNSIETRFRVKTYLKNPTRLMRALAELKIFETTGNEFISLKNLVKQFAEKGFVPFSQKMFDDRHPEDLEVLYLDSGKKIEFFNKIFTNKVENVEQDFIRAIKRRKNIDAWNYAKTDRVVLLSDTIIRRSVESENVHGEIGLTARESDGRCHIFFSKENGLICEKHIEINGLSIDASVNNNNLNPVYTWDDLNADKEFVETIRAILIHSHFLYLNLSEKMKEMSSPDFIRFDKETLRYKKKFDIHRMHLVNYMNFILDKAEKDSNDGLREITVKFTADNSFYDPGAVKRKVVKLEDSSLTITDTIKRLRIFPTVEGKMVSLKELEDQVLQRAIIPYVTKEMVGPGVDNLHVIMATGRREFELLEKYFGADKVRNYEKELTEERHLMQHLNRPVEKPEISEPVIEKISVSKMDAVGEMGLLAKAIDRSRFQFMKMFSNYPEPASFTILKKNRMVTTLLINFPTGGIKVSVNYDRIGINSSWSDILEDKTWSDLKEIILSVLPDLAFEVAAKYESYEYKEKIRAKVFLQQFSAFHFRNSSYVSKSDSVSLKIKKVSIFKDISGRPLSLADIEESRRESGRIAYVDAFLPETGALNRLVCSVSVSELEILKNIFGRKNFENFETKVKSRITDEVVKKAKPHEEPEIDDKSILVKKEYRDVQGISGQVGLLRSCYVLSSLTLLKENRQVMTKVIDTKMKIEASLNYDQLTTNQGWTSVVKDEKFKCLMNFLTNAQDDLVRMLLESYDSLSEEDKSEAFNHITDYLTTSRKKYTEVRSEKSNSLIGKLARMKIFRELSGSAFSFIDITNIYEKSKKLKYVLFAGKHKPVDKDNIVLILNQRNLQQLKLMFPCLYDYTADLALEQIALRNMSKPPLESLTVGENCIVKITVNTKHMQGELALPDKLPVRDTIVFAKEKISVVSKQLYPRSNVFGVINSDSFRTNPVFTDVLLREREKNVLFNRIQKLYETLVDDWQNYQQAASGETARKLLLEFYCEQKYHTGSEFRIMNEDLERKIASLPLLPIHDGRFVSISVIAGEAERQGFISYFTTREDYQVSPEDIVLKIEPYSFEYEFCRRILGADRLKHYIQIRKPSGETVSQQDVASVVPEPVYINSEQKDKDIRMSTFLPTSLPADSEKESEPVELTEGYSAGEKLPDNADFRYSVLQEKYDKKYEEYSQKEIDSERITKKDVEPVEKDREVFSSLSADVSPEMKLLSSIRREFRIIRTRKHYNLSENILCGAGIIHQENAPAVICRNGNLMINYADPLVKKIADSLDDSPHMLYYLLSIIYSRINRDLLEITDEDEMNFQMIMLENLLQYPSLASGSQIK
jgi:hypothetical protein